VTLETTWLDPINLAVTALLFLIGLLCLLTQRRVIKQVIGIKIMLQAVTLNLISAGYQSGNMHLAETMVISALVAETIVIAIALALIVNIYRRDPTGDIDKLDRLKG